jgi:hypothetical protein
MKKLLLIISLVSASVVHASPLPNSCVLIAQKAQQFMNGQGEVVVVYIKLANGKSYGHAVYVNQLNSKFCYIYDDQGSRLVPGNYKDMNWFLLPIYIFERRGLNTEGHLEKGVLRPDFL